MQCYAKNPALLSSADCHRTVCIHCRIDFSPPVLTGGGPLPWMATLRTPPKPAANGPLPSAITIRQK